ncbi:hypothetical protein BV20DRAFT_201198 [Pilatotrama ljubarskyi]|nr:hypothetical protein BV20DRAFT_201198 [Pilatotrama ljubarskyi]
MFVSSESLLLTFNFATRAFSPTCNAAGPLCPQGRDAGNGGVSRRRCQYSDAPSAASCSAARRCECHRTSRSAAHGHESVRTRRVRLSKVPDTLVAGRLENANQLPADLQSTM